MTKTARVKKAKKMDLKKSEQLYNENKNYIPSSVLIATCNKSDFLDYN